jgi:hypothetical protein
LGLGSLTVRCLERRAGGQRRPARLCRHTRPVCALDACPESGLVLTSAEDGSVSLWRSAAAMARAEDAELGHLLVPADGAASYAWVLPPAHLARLRAGPLYRNRAAASADAARRLRPRRAVVRAARRRAALHGAAV